MNLPPKIRATALLAPACLLFAPLVHAAAIGFEPGEGFAADSDVATAAGWTKSTPGAAKISTDEAQSGRQSLKIAASNGESAATTTFPIPDDGIVFLDFAILPTADGSKTPLSTIDANGAVLGFIKTEGQGHVVALTAPGDKGSSPNIVDAGHPFAVDEQGIATDWIRITIRENLKAGKWDLYVDGRLALIDQPLLGKAHGKNGALSFEASPVGSAYADTLSITGENPLFADADKDGIPDAVEKATGSNPLFDDRATLTSMGLSNIQCLLSVSASAFSKTLSGGLGPRVIYVDNTVGSDQQTGELSYRVQGRGPKATLKGAIENADIDTVVAILPSDRPYQIQNALLKAPGVINLLPLENVTITTVEK